MLVDDKSDEQQIETQDQHGDMSGFAAHQTFGIVKSRWDDLPIIKAIWVFRKAAFYSFLMYTTSLMEGFFITISGAIIVNQGFINQFGDTLPDGTKVLNTNWISAWSGVINAGQFVMGFIVPPLADRYGRKVAFYLCWVFFVAALIALTLAKSSGVWLLGKILIGWGVGIAQLTATPYVMEIAPTRVRGGIVIFGVIWSIIGSILVSLMLQICNQRYPLNFRLPIHVVWGPAIGMLFCFLLVPESPWHYARHGNQEKCIKVLRNLYGNIDGFDLQEEYEVIQRNIDHEKSLRGEAKATSWRDILRGGNRRRFIIMLVLAMSQQLGGLALVGSYSTYFFSLAGLADPFLASLVQTCTALGAIVIYTLIIDKVGRRLPICISFTVMTITLWIIGGLFYAGATTVHNALLAMCCIWQPCFTLVGNSYFLLASELPTATLRLKTGAVSWMLTALFSIACTWAVPPMLVHLGIRAAFVFGAMSVPCCAFFWFYIPETKGRSVSEIDELFERKVPAWRWSSFETEAEKVMRQAVQAEDDAKTTV